MRVIENKSTPATVASIAAMEYRAVKAFRGGTRVRPGGRWTGGCTAGDPDGFGPEDNPLSRPTGTSASVQVRFNLRTATKRPRPALVI
jgi:hypothetical protein